MKTYKEIVHHCVCAGCKKEITISNMSKHKASKILRLHGWKYVNGIGNLCRECFLNFDW